MVCICFSDRGEQFSTLGVTLFLGNSEGEYFRSWPGAILKFVNLQVWPVLGLSSII